MIHSSAVPALVPYSAMRSGVGSIRHLVYYSPIDPTHRLTHFTVNAALQLVKRSMQLPRDYCCPSSIESLLLHTVLTLAIGKFAVNGAST